MSSPGGDYRPSSRPPSRGTSPSLVLLLPPVVLLLLGRSLAAVPLDGHGRILLVALAVLVAAPLHGHGRVPLVALAASIVTAAGAVLLLAALPASVAVMGNAGLGRSVSIAHIESGFMAGAHQGVGVCYSH